MPALVETEGISLPSSQNRNFLNSSFPLLLLLWSRVSPNTIEVLFHHWNQRPLQKLGMFPQQEPGSKFSPEVFFSPPKGPCSKSSTFQWTWDCQRGGCSVKGFSLAQFLQCCVSTASKMQTAIGCWKVLVPTGEQGSTKSSW